MIIKLSPILCYNDAVLGSLSSSLLSHLKIHCYNNHQDFPVVKFFTQICNGSQHIEKAPPVRSITAIMLLFLRLH